MTDLEISKQLALAIGWPKDRLSVQGATVVWIRNAVRKSIRQENLWDIFDYRDWDVIGPIAERYNCFPQKGTGIFGDEYWWVCTDELDESYADTPQKAIALAVIGAKK